MNCIFVADLHGRIDRYQKLFALIEQEKPAAVFLGGDLLPFGGGLGEVQDFSGDFIGDFLAPRMKECATERRWIEAISLTGRSRARRRPSMF